MTLKDWDQARRSESIDPNTPIQWSKWVREKVDTALNVDVLQSTVSDAATIEVQNLRRDNETLKKRLAALESRETGVSFNRVIGLLQCGEYVDFNVVVQRLIDTEAQAAYRALTAAIPAQSSTHTLDLTYLTFSHTLGTQKAKNVKCI